MLCTTTGNVKPPLSWGAQGPPPVPEVPEGSTTFYKLRLAKATATKGTGYYDRDLAPIELGLQPGVDP
jgi:hypothetical protein